MICNKNNLCKGGRLFDVQKENEQGEPIHLPTDEGVRVPSMRGFSFHFDSQTPSIIRSVMLEIGDRYVYLSHAGPEGRSTL